MVLFAEPVLVLSPVTAAVAPKFSPNVAAVVRISVLDAVPPMLPVRLERVRAVVVTVFEDDDVMFPEPVDRLIACIPPVPKLLLIVIGSELPRSTPTVRFVTALLIPNW